LNQSEPNVILTAHATKVNRPEPNWTEPQTCLAGRNHAFNNMRLILFYQSRFRRHRKSIKHYSLPVCSFVCCDICFDQMENLELCRGKRRQYMPSISLTCLCRLEKIGLQL